jgi:hypothetical protein
MARLRFDIRDTARHEAGHAVFAIRHGIRFDHAVVYEDRSGGQVTTRGVASGNYPNWITMYLMGAIGAVVVGPRRSWLQRHVDDGASEDFASARALIALLPEAWRFVGDIEEHFSRRAEEFAKTNRRQIEAVADALFERRRLSEAEVTQIIAAV